MHARCMHRVRAGGMQSRETSPVVKEGARGEVRKGQKKDSRDEREREREIERLKRVEGRGGGNS